MTETQVTYEYNCWAVFTPGNALLSHSIRNRRRDTIEVVERGGNWAKLRRRGYRIEKVIVKRQTW